MRFKDRLDAARLLVQALEKYRGTHPLVLAIPRGAVPMGALIASALGGQLDVVLVRKLGALLFEVGRIPRTAARMTQRGVL